MPYHKDFDELYYRGEFPLQPDGWEPLTIEYGYDDIGGAQFFFWRIKETRHTFRVSVSELNHQTSGGSYEEQIEKFLEGFREEMLGWIFQKIEAEWTREYFNEYNKWVKL
jgi:hypothetical protein